MTYTSNVPLGNQTIAETTDPIRNNFGFIQTTLRTEHVFNGNVPGAAEGVHTQVSMPNMADPVAGTLPTGTNGMFYINSGGPKYFNNTTSYILQTTPLYQNVLYGTAALGTGAFTTVFSIPAFSQGYYTLAPRNGGLVANLNAMQAGFIISGAATLVDTSSDFTYVLVNYSGLSLQMKAVIPGAAGTYNFVLVYWTVP